MPGLRFLRHSDKAHSAVSVSSKCAVNIAAGTISIMPPIVPMVDVPQAGGLDDEQAARDHQADGAREQEVATHAQSRYRQHTARPIRNIRPAATAAKTFHSPNDDTDR